MASPEQTLGQWMASWFETTQARARWNTANAYHRQLKHLYSDPISRLRLSAVKAPHVRQLHASLLAKGLSPLSVRHIHARLSQVLAQAVREEVIDKNVAAFVTPPQVPDREVKTLTVSEVGRLLSLAPSPLYRALWGVMAIEGLRPGEAIALTWSNVDLARRRLAVTHTAIERRGADGGTYLGPPKTASSRRTLVLSELMVDALTQLRPRVVRLDGSDPVFPAPRGGRMWSQDVRKALRLQLGAAGLPEVSPHKLRHSAATNHLEDGADVQVVQELLGHKSAKTTLDVYGHVREGRHVEAMARMDERLRRST